MKLQEKPGELEEANWLLDSLNSNAEVTPPTSSSYGEVPTAPESGRS